MTRLRITFWLAVIGTCMIALAHAMNPYEELGVSSRSTAAQIKKVQNKKYYENMTIILAFPINVVT